MPLAVGARWQHDSTTLTPPWQLVQEENELLKNPECLRVQLLWPADTEFLDRLLLDPSFEASVHLMQVDMDPAARIGGTGGTGAVAGGSINPMARLTDALQIDCFPTSPFLPFLAAVSAWACRRVATKALEEHAGKSAVTIATCRCVHAGQEKPS